MRRFLCFLPFIFLLVLASVGRPKTDSAANLLQQFENLWKHVQSYTCTAVVHEAKGPKVQDRVYHIFFQKPYNTRAEIIAGDDKGSVGIWEGGNRVRGHRGGMLSLFKLNLDIHDPLATSMRGTTIAQSNLGFLLKHLQSVGAENIHVDEQGAHYVLSTRVHDPPPNEDVVREVYIFGLNGLPVEGFQYGQHDTLLKHIVYSSFRLNVALPASTWQM